MYQLADKRVPFVSLNVMILMEYTEGETLRDIIDKSPEYLTRGMIFTLFIQMMTALKKIHSSGLIHRDIKPENIFVNRKTNALQVGDFGLAKSFKQTEGV
jgi:serine/threonine protein kinase